MCNNEVVRVKTGNNFVWLKFLGWVEEGSPLLTRWRETPPSSNKAADFHLLRMHSSSTFSTFDLYLSLKLIFSIWHIFTGFVVLLIESFEFTSTCSANQDSSEKIRLSLEFCYSLLNKTGWLRKRLEFAQWINIFSFASSSIPLSEWVVGQSFQLAKLWGMGACFNQPLFNQSISKKFHEKSG